MSLINYAFKGNFKRFDANLDKVSAEYHISKFKLYARFFRCFMMTGCGYSDYLNYKLYLRSDEEIKRYVTIKDQDYFYEIVSPSKYKTFFTIKSEFLKNFRDYIDRDFFYQGSYEEFEKFLNDNAKIIYKPVNSLGGDRVKAVNTADIKDRKAFFKEVSDNGILLEEYVIQHPDMMALAPESCNTVRVMTFAYGGKSEILCAMQRVGNGIADVDNFHQGGMGVKIDLETGKLVGDAVNKDGVIFSEHPFTRIKFDGYQLPNWEILKDTCLKAALVNKNIHVVGWDVAITPEGCTFIEGNRRPGFDLPQELYDRGRMDIVDYCLGVINKAEGTAYGIRR